MWDCGYESPHSRKQIFSKFITNSVLSYFLFLSCVFAWIFSLNSHVMTLILDKSSGVDTDLSRSFTNISQTVGVNLHTVEDKISFGSIYECPTIFMSWLLFIQLFDHETSPSSFVFLYVFIVLFWEFWAEIQIKYETVGVILHTVENKISLNSIYECLTFLMLASFGPILDHEMSSSSFILFYIFIDFFCELWGWNSNQMWNCGCKSPHS